MEPSQILIQPDLGFVRGIHDESTLPNKLVRALFRIFIDLQNRRHVRVSRVWLTSIAHTKDAILAVNFHGRRQLQRTSSLRQRRLLLVPARMTRAILWDSSYCQHRNFRWIRAAGAVAPVVGGNAASDQ